jgi:hypothetical protein
MLPEIAKVRDLIANAGARVAAPLANRIIVVANHIDRIRIVSRGTPARPWITASDSCGAQRAIRKNVSFLI